MNIPKYIQDIMMTLNRAGYQAYVVGGCVRDYLMDRDPHDYDMTTDASPEIVQSLFERTAPTGLKHGTVTILSETPVEITTFRQDKDYIDHRHPTSVSFVKDVKEDLARRDFTMNAIAYSINTGYVDPFGGIQDIQNKIIRCVGNPQKRFEEDALSMLRAYRFSAQLGFTIEENTKSAIQDKHDLISYISIERIRSELIKILEKNPLVLYEMTDLFKKWIPELETCKNCEQNTKWHSYDVLMHTLKAISYLDPFDETLAYTLLFHDLGKPISKTTKDGVDHFKGHPKVSCEISKRLVQIFKLTKEQQRVIPILVLLHDEHTYCTLDTLYKFRIEYGLSDLEMKQLIQVRKCDILAHSPLGQSTIQESLDFEIYYEKEKELHPFSFEDLKISGKDIKDQLHISGMDIRKAYQACLNYCFYHPEKNNVVECIQYLKEEEKWKF